MNCFWRHQTTWICFYGNENSKSMKGSNLNLRWYLHIEGQFCHHLECVLPFGSFKDTLNFFIYILQINTFGNKFRLLPLRLRGSHWRCSVRKGIRRNFEKFTGKHLCQGLFCRPQAFRRLLCNFSNQFIHDHTSFILTC